MRTIKTRLTLEGIERISSKNKKRQKGKSIREKLKNYTVIDLETTGKYVTSCEIIEIAAVKVRFGEIVGTFNTLVKPSSSVPNEVVKLTGITDEMLEDAPSISEVIDDFVNFIDDDIILGHNITAFEL